MFTLRVEGNPEGSSEGGPEIERPLSSRPVLVGRSPGADLLLADDAVSGHHAAVWTDGATVWVQDLGSRNGVRLNGAPVAGPTRASPGDQILIGRTTLVVRGDAGPGPAQGTRLVVEDLGTGTGAPFDGERLRIGGSPAAHLRVEGADDVVLVRISEAEVLLGVGDDMRPLAVGEPFVVGGRSFVLRPVEGSWRATRDLEPVSGYLVEATLEGGPGPLARIRDPRTGASHEVRAENRATLLWVLVRRWVDAAAVPEEQRGWVSEAEMLTSLWGRAPGGSATNLRVLVCRIRKDLREAGLDPWFLEHRAGHLRTRIGGATLW